MAAPVHVELPRRMAEAVETIADRLAISRPEVLRRALALYLLAVEKTLPSTRTSPGVAAQGTRHLAIEEDGEVKEIFVL